MPRKIDTHPGEQSETLPTDNIDTFKLPFGIEALLPEKLSQANFSAALQGISHALGEYDWECKAGPYRYTRAEAWKALRELLRSQGSPGNRIELRRASLSYVSRARG